jgi:hypothetical protein
MDLSGIMWGVVEWINLTQNRDWSWVLVSTVPNF